MIRYLCAAGYCLNLVDVRGAFCEKHQHLEKERAAAIAARNARSWEKLHSRQAQTGQLDLYRTARWRRLRAAVLEASPTCARCGNPATDVHHVVPANGDPSIFFDRSNLVALCHACHGELGRAEARKHANPYPSFKNGRAQE